MDGRVERAVTELLEALHAHEQPQDVLLTVEKAVTQYALDRNGGHQRHAAHWLGISRWALSRRVAQWGLTLPDKAPESAILGSEVTA